MGQQPNIELEMSQLPRPQPKPAPARAWRPQRPGDIDGPSEMPWGGAFGTTGPDPGYALKLVAERTLALGPNEDHHNAEASVAMLAAARASHFGRAPTPGDVDVAMLILGYAPEGLPADLLARIEKERGHKTANLSHDGVRARALAGAVPLENLVAPLDDLKERMRDGEALVLW